MDLKASHPPQEPTVRPFAGIELVLVAMSNLTTLGIALWERWPMTLMLWPFWTQSMVFCGGILMRMRQRGGGAWVLSRLPMLLFFGSAHTFALLRLSGVWTMDMARVMVTPGLISACAIAAVTQWMDCMRQLRADRTLPPGYDQLESLLALRVIGIHLLILLGLGLIMALAYAYLPRLAATSAAGLIVVTGFKTAIDLFTLRQQNLMRHAAAMTPYRAVPPQPEERSKSSSQVRWPYRYKKTTDPADTVAGSARSAALPRPGRSNERDAD